MDQNVISYLLYGILVFLLFFFYGIVYLSEVDIKKNKFFKLKVKFFGSILYPVYVVLSYPIFQISYSMLFCWNNNDYYLNECKLDTKRTIDSSIAILVLILSILMFMIVSSFYLHINPFVDSPLSRPMKINLVKGLLLKMFLPLIFQIFPSSLRQISLWFALVLLVFEQIRNVFIPISFKKDITEFFILLNSLELWLVFCGCVNFVI